MTSGFTFAGKRTQDFGLRIEKRPAQRGAARRRTSVSVPGRMGNLHYDEDAYDNYDQPYKCGFVGDGSIPDQAHAIKSWLLTAAANQRLEDTYDPDHYRLASFSGPVDIEDQLNRIGKVTVTFDCDPRFFLKSGEEPIVLTEQSSNLENFTDCPARPIITVYGTGAAYLNINGLTIIIKDISEHIVLDCEMLNAYKYHTEDVLENKNGDISAADFPVLKPGNNLIQFNGAITHIEIIPRWYTL